MPLNASRQFAADGPLGAEPFTAAVGTAVDFSTSRPTRAALAGAGALAVGRYISYPGGSDKDISAAEAALYRSWGLNVFIYWEDQVADALGGRATGQAMARYAQAQVAARGGPADGGVIYACVDFDATAGQMPTVLDWFRGWRDVRPVELCGVYAGLRPVQAVLDAGLARYACQTRAWSGGVWDTRAQLQQYSWTALSDGSQVDLLRIMDRDYGQWAGQEADMTPEEHGWLRDIHDQVSGATAAGQKDFASTVSSTLATVQSLVNIVRAGDSALAARLADTQTAVLGAVAALPTDHLTDAERAQLAADIAAKVSGLDQAAVLDALAARLAA